MGSESLWNEMLDEFRSLGGRAENVRLGCGRFGRGLFPVNPKEPVVIHVPDNLLISVDDVVFDNNVFRVRPSAALDSRRRAFIEQYERDFSWNIAYSEMERFLSMMNELPEGVREQLTKNLRLGRFFEPMVPQRIQKYVLGSRALSFCNTKLVIMPILELANYGPGPRFDVEQGVSLHGVFDEEVLVRYTIPSDPYGLFAHWMFAVQEPTAFCLAMNLNLGGRKIRIGRTFAGETAPWVPKVSIDGNRILAPFLLLGHRQFPRLPKGAFLSAMSGANLDNADEVYEIIQHVNCQKFLDLLAALENVNLPAVPLLRRMAHSQLDALSFHYGIRQT